MIITKIGVKFLKVTNQHKVPQAGVSGLEDGKRRGTDLTFVPAPPLPPPAIPMGSSGSLQ